MDCSRAWTDIMSDSTMKAYPPSVPQPENPLNVSETPNIVKERMSVQSETNVKNVCVLE